MKYKILFILAGLILFSNTITAQNPKSKFSVKFSGYIKNDAVFNTRQVKSARAENLLFLAPLPVDIDSDGVDINSTSNYNIAGIGSRLKAHITGPDVLGAKTFGYIETDFYGSNGTTKFNARLRHAYLKLKWEKSELLTGQFWHPIFVTDCFPGVLTEGAAAPINPLSRNPQFRYTFNLSNKLSFFVAAVAQGHFVGTAPAGSDHNSATPELHAQLKYKSYDKESGIGFMIGAGFGMQSLKPELFTTNGDKTYKADKKVNSITALAFTRITLPKITFKLYGMYGQNNTNAVMQGGYAMVDRVYTPLEIQKGVQDYTPYNILSGWIDIHNNSKVWQVGFFGGFSKNLGADENIIAGSGSGRWLDVQSMLRFAPRIAYVSGKTKFGFEAEYATANYADNNTTAINSKGKVINYTKADNLRFLLSIVYSF